MSLGHDGQDIMVGYVVARTRLGTNVHTLVCALVYRHDHKLACTHVYAHGYLCTGPKLVFSFTIAQWLIQKFTDMG